jgi:hypothetical protein
VDCQCIVHIISLSFGKSIVEPVYSLHTHSTGTQPRSSRTTSIVRLPPPVCNDPSFIPSDFLYNCIKIANDDASPCMPFYTTHTTRQPAPCAEQMRMKGGLQTLKRSKVGKKRHFRRLWAAGRPGGVPLGDLHRAVLVEVLVHVEGIPD